MPSSFENKTPSITHPINKRTFTACRPGYNKALLPTLPSNFPQAIMDPKTQGLQGAEHMIHLVEVFMCSAP